MSLTYGASCDSIFCRSFDIFNYLISNSPVSLLILPVSQGIQSKQQTCTSLRIAFLVPGRQLALQIDSGTYRDQTTSKEQVNVS